MKYLTALSIIFILALFRPSDYATSFTGDKLYPVSENGLWGFINTSGDVVIKPRFHSVGTFSEGMAAARLDGSYGYIDRSGEYVIPPLYDKAELFEFGQAKVYVDAKPFYIDPSGERTFSHEFSEIAGFGNNGFSKVTSEGGKFGIIDRCGNILLDTIYREIQDFSDGFAVIHGSDHVSYGDSTEINIEIGVIDTTGKITIPFGIFYSIDEFTEGLATARLLDNAEGARSGIVIDPNGRKVFSVPHDKWYIGFDGYSEGLAGIFVKKSVPIVNVIETSHWSKSYVGVIDTSGILQFSDKRWEEITPFSQGRAFVKRTNGLWYLIDRNGNVLSKKGYDEISQNVYPYGHNIFTEEGKQLVKLAGGWFLIDRSGKRASEILNEDIRYAVRDKVGNIILLESYEVIAEEEYEMRYGFWNAAGNILVAPKYQQLHISHADDELISVVENGRMGYIDLTGKYVWRAPKSDNNGKIKLNIDYMNRGYFYASSPPSMGSRQNGGYGESGNLFSTIVNSSLFEDHKLNLLADVRSDVDFLGRYEGFRLHVANTTRDTQYFGAQDSRLYLVVQAKYINNEWRDIEYIPSSWCGNSYHQLYLPPGKQWDFQVPRYHGAIKTTLRAVLTAKSGKHSKVDTLIFSNEFSGSVNPGQFWVKREYISNGLMDPYIE